MENQQLSNKIEICVECSNLERKDFISKSNPCCRLKIGEKTDPNRTVWTNLSCSEVVKGDLNPSFSKSFVVDYYFEEQQFLKFEIFHVPKVEEFNGQIVSGLHEYIGGTTFSLADAVSKGKLSSGLDFREGKIHITSREIETLDAVTSNVEILFVGKDIKNVDLLGSSDPFFVLSSDKRIIYTSEIHDNDCNPIFNPLFINLFDFCKGDKQKEILCEVYDEGKLANTLIGSFSFNLKTLEEKGRNTEFQILDKKGKNVGDFVCKKFSIHKKRRLSYYLSEGMEISIITAIDFTLSNGDPSHPKSLHFIDETGKANSYQECIMEVGKIISQYDKSNLYPVLGFGGKFNGSKTVSHCQIINKNAGSLENVIKSYKESLNTTELSGPTYFNKVIKYVVKKYGANGYDEEGNFCKNYYIFLIITDGTIDDYDKTLKQISKSTSLPLSIIILGVGDENFYQMERLDEILEDRSFKFLRDNVQFVNYTNLKKKNALTLTRKVLKPIPEQVMDFFEIKKKRERDKMNENLKRDLEMKKKEVELEKEREKQRLEKIKMEEKLRLKEEKEREKKEKEERKRRKKMEKEEERKRKKEFEIQEKLRIKKEKEEKQKQKEMMKKQKYLDETAKIIIYAQQNNHAAIIELFKKGKVDLDVTDCLGKTAVFFSAQSGFVEITKLLAQSGANVEQCIKNYLSYSKDIKKIIQQYAKSEKIDELAISEAFEENDFEYFKTIVTNTKLNLNSKIRGNYISHKLAKLDREMKYFEFFSDLPNVNLIDIGRTAIEILLEKKSYEKVKFLVVKGTDVSKVKKKKENLMHIFSKIPNSEEILSVLCQKFPKLLEQKNKQQEVPIFCAYKIQKKVKSNFDVLLSYENNEKVILSLIKSAMENYEYDLFKVLTKKKIDINKKVDSQYIIHLSINRGIEYLKEIVKMKGLNIDVKDHDANTPLEVSLARNKLKHSQLLIDNNANLKKIKFENEDNNGILHYFARRKNNEEMIRFILKNHKSMLKSKNGHKELPIHCAQNFSCWNNLCVLLEFEENETVLLDTLKTCIHKKKFDIYHKILTEKKSIINLNKKTSGTYLIHDIVRYIDLKYLEEFFNHSEKKIDVDPLDKDNNTPLEVSLELNKLKIAQYLISKGSNVKKICLENQNNDTILHYFCRRKNNGEIIDLIISKCKSLIKKRNSFLELPGIAALNGKLYENFTPILNADDNEKNFMEYLMKLIEHNDLKKFSQCFAKMNNFNLNKKVNGVYPIHKCIRYSTLDILKLLVSHSSIKIDQKDEQNNTPLEVVLSLEKLPQAFFLIEKGADMKKIKFENDFNNNILHYFAKRKGNEEIIRKILEKHNSMKNMKNSIKQTPILLALREKCFGNFNELLKEEKNEDILLQLLQLAIPLDDVELFKKILDHKKEINVNKKVNGVYIIHLLLTNFDMMKYFLENDKVNIDLRDSRDNTVLENALSQEKHDFAQLLINKGSDVMKIQFENENNNNIIHYYAKREGHFDILSELIKKVPSLLVEKNRNGEMPIMTAFNFQKMENFYELLKKENNDSNLIVFIHEACQTKNIKLLSAVFDQKKDVNINKKVEGEYPLHVAVNVGDVEIVKKVISFSGVNMDVKDSYKNTVLENALDQNKTEIARVLINICDLTKIKFENEDNNNSLHFFARRDNPEMFSIVKNKNDKLNLGLEKEKNENKMTPIEVALFHKKIENFKILLEKEENEKILLKVLYKSITDDLFDIFQMILQKKGKNYNRKIEKNYILHLCVSLYDDSKIKYLKEFVNYFSKEERKVDLEVKDFESNTALEVSLVKENMKMAQFLWEIGADVTKVIFEKDYNNTILHYFSKRKSSEEYIKSLIHKFPKMIKKKNSLKQTSIILSILNDCYSNFALLFEVEKSDEVLCEVAFHAFSKNKIDLFSEIIFKKTDFNVNKKFLKKFYLIHKVCLSIDYLQLLFNLKQKVDLNLNDEDGNTALEICLRENKFDCGKLLITKGTNLFKIKFETDHDNNILHFFSKNNNVEDIEMIKFILNSNKSHLKFLKEKNSSGLTPVELACEFSNFEKVKVLLEYDSFSENFISVIFFCLKSSKINVSFISSVFDIYSKKSSIINLNKRFYFSYVIHELIKKLSENENEHYTCLKNFLNLKNIVIDLKDDLKETPLKICLTLNKTKFANLFIDKGVDITRLFIYGNTILHYYSKRNEENSIVVIKKILEKHSFLKEVKNDRNEIPGILALKNNCLSNFDLLFENEDQDKIILDYIKWSINNNNFQLFKKFLNKLPELNVNKKIENEYLLHLIIRKTNDPLFLKEILKKETLNLDVKDNDSNTPLEVSLTLNKVNFALDLINSGANLLKIKFENDWNNSILHYFSKREKSGEIITSILEKEKKLFDIKNSHGKKPILLSLKSGCWGNFFVLLSYESNDFEVLFKVLRHCFKKSDFTHFFQIVKAKSTVIKPNKKIKGKYLLHEVLSNIQMVKCLLDVFKESINLEVKDKESNTPLEVAMRNEWHDIVKLLLSKGADMKIIRFENDYNNTVLHHYSKKKGMVGMLKLILKKIPSLFYVKNKKGLTAGQLALMNKCISNFEFLLSFPKIKDPLLLEFVKLCLEYNLKSCLEKIFELYPDLNINKKISGEWILHIALGCDFGIFKKLLELVPKNVDYLVKNEKGLTVIAAAAKLGFDEKFLYMFHIFQKFETKWSKIKFSSGKCILHVLAKRENSVELIRDVLEKEPKLISKKKKCATFSAINSNRFENFVELLSWVTKENRILKIINKCIKMDKELKWFEELFKCQVDMSVGKGEKKGVMNDLLKGKRIDVAELLYKVNPSVEIDSLLLEAAKQKKVDLVKRLILDGAVNQELKLDESTGHCFLYFLDLTKKDILEFMLKNASIAFLQYGNEYSYPKRFSSDEIEWIRSLTRFEEKEKEIEIVQIQLDARAEGLPKMDIGAGTCDGYYKIYKNGKLILKSNVKKNTLNPKWKQELLYIEEYKKTDEYQFQIFDWDRLSKDDWIGGFNIKLSELSKGKEIVIRSCLNQNHGKFIIDSLEIKKHKKTIDNRVHRDLVSISDCCKNY